LNKKASRLEMLFIICLKTFFVIYMKQKNSQQLQL
jgi:hypothetical protein